MTGLTISDLQIRNILTTGPIKFAGVVVLQHNGAGIAAWNLANYVYSLKNMKLIIDGQPVIVYHFHGVKQIYHWIYDTNIISYKTRLSMMLNQERYIPYLKELNPVNHILNKYN